MTLKTLNECHTENVIEKYDAPIKYKPLYFVCILLTIAAPYIGGPVIALNEKCLTQWGWLPYYENYSKGKTQA